MKNLFDFATKELSQDAFLCWFFANYTDKRISKYLYSFIYQLVGLTLEKGDIKYLTIKQQPNDIDIVIDFWTSEDRSNTSESHYVIIIEDKTSSSAHDNQLKRYSDEMSKWNTKEPGYEKRRFKVFYKANNLSDQDRRELDYSAKNSLDKTPWIEFSIDNIHKFFSTINNTGSEIFDCYVEHIKNIFKDLHDVSSKPVNEWSLVNFQTFIQSVYNKYFKDKYPCHFETWQYRGSLASGAFYYHPECTKKPITKSHPYYAYPLIDFIFRENDDSVKVSTHITYHWLKDINDPKSDDWSWKLNEYGGDNKDEAKLFMEGICDCIKKSRYLKTRNMEKGSNQTVSTEVIYLKDCNGKLISNYSFEETIINIIKEYFKAFKVVDHKIEINS